MEYMIEPIGAVFSNSDVAGLAKRFTSRSVEGYELHSVFQVIQPGCLGIFPRTITYLAVYVRPGSADGSPKPENPVAPATATASATSGSVLSANASKEELMAHYGIFFEEGEFVLRNHRFASLDAALRHARHQEKLRGGS